MTQSRQDAEKCREGIGVMPCPQITLPTSASLRLCVNLAHFWPYIHTRCAENAANGGSSGRSFCGTRAGRLPCTFAHSLPQTPRRWQRGCYSHDPVLRLNLTNDLRTITSYADAQSLYRHSEPKSDKGVHHEYRSDISIECICRRRETSSITTTALQEFPHHAITLSSTLWRWLFVHFVLVSFSGCFAANYAGG